ncbi:hypothetical protein SDC9_58252 [bioreactor metagenome]|uniref:Uncharacterized protein n=1 Tax=bioreactor metagenome TaxID=1076179 RepID=A0A644X7W6_9ZZZZ
MGWGCSLRRIADHPGVFRREKCRTSPEDCRGDPPSCPGAPRTGPFPGQGSFLQGAADYPGAFRGLPGKRGAGPLRRITAGAALPVQGFPGRETSPGGFPLKKVQKWLFVPETLFPFLCIWEDSVKPCAVRLEGLIK